MKQERKMVVEVVGGLLLVKERRREEKKEKVANKSDLHLSAGGYQSWRLKLTEERALLE